MNILVTGGAGFIGTFTVKKLLNEQKHNIIVIDNLSTGVITNIPEQVKFIYGDICNKNFLEKLKLDCIDVIYHFAAQTSVPYSVNNPADDCEVNIKGLVNVLELAIKCKVKKIIFSSSAAVYGDNKNVPISEDEIPKPLAPYGISKYTGEIYLRWFCSHFGMQYVILRYANVYGPKHTSKGEGGVIKIFIERALENKENLIYGDGLQTRDFIYVEDIANANIHALMLPSGIYNIGHGEEITVKSLISNINDGFQKKCIFSYKEKRDGDIYRSCLNNEKIIANGWFPVYSLKEGVKKTIEAMESELHYI